MSDPWLVGYLVWAWLVNVLNGSDCWIVTHGHGAASWLQLLCSL